MLVRAIHQATKIASHAHNYILHSVLCFGRMPVSYTHLDVYKRQEDVYAQEVSGGFPAYLLTQQLNPAGQGTTLSLIHI